MRAKRRVEISIGRRGALLSPAASWGLFFLRGVERGATRRAPRCRLSIRLERNPRTLTYSTSTTRQRRAPHSQRGGRRPRGDVSPTGRVFHTARSIKVGASQPSNRRPCHRIRRNLYEAVAARRTHSHAAIRQYVHLDDGVGPASTNRVHGHVGPRRARRRWHQPRRRRVVWPWRQALRGACSGRWLRNLVMVAHSSAGS